MIDHDIRHHLSNQDRSAERYRADHPEIFNEIEQSRLRAELKNVLENYSLNPEPLVLDYCAHMGTLTKHLIDLGCTVTACDPDKRSLKSLLKENPLAQPLLFNGRNLPLPDDLFDIVATYAGLHRVRDYLGAIKDMLRVLKPGGLLFIDHEYTNSHWVPNGLLAAYYEFIKIPAWKRFSHLIRSGGIFAPSMYKTIFMRLCINRRYDREGNMHIWPGDHVEWPRVLELLAELECAVIEDKDYLFYAPEGGMEIFTKYNLDCSDMKMLIVRKNKL